MYDAAHIGHARTYINTDIIRRIITDYFQYNVVFAMGITDIDDKIINKAADLGLYDWEGCKTIVRPLEDDFFSELDALNVQRTHAVLRVSEHVEEIVAYIEKIMEEQKAYVTSDGVYFDVESHSDSYGKLGIGGKKTDVEGMSDAEEELLSADPEVTGVNNKNDKRSPKDFALWKFSKSSNEPSWDSPWGAGRPGWHIECSAMTHALFGPKVDIHSGGVDLKFPHHTNEIAQCEAHNCSDHWVSYWIHTGHLHIDGRKMSKSLKNFITIKEYMNAQWSSYPAVDLRLFFLQHKYSSLLHFSKDRINEAASLRRKIQELFEGIAMLQELAHSYHAPEGPTKKSNDQSKLLLHHLTTCKDEVRKSLADDFDTPAALSSISSLILETNVYKSSMMSALEKRENTFPMEPLLSVKMYLTYIFDMLGVPTYVLDVRSSRVDRYDEINDDNGRNFSKAVDALVNFRSKVRKAGIDGNKIMGKILKICAKGTYSEKELMQDLEAASEALKEVMSSCDWARDDLGNSMGVRITDISAERSSWTRANKS